MILARGAIAALAVGFVGCGAPEPQHPQSARAVRPATEPRQDRQLTESVRRLQLLLNQLQTMSGSPETSDSLRIVGMDAGPVPGFELIAADGAQYSSKALVGKRPFVAVFFATWCDYCQGQLKTMQLAMAQSGPITIIPVSVDGPETWHKVPAYLASFGIREGAVRAHDYPLFAASYNPVDILPSLVVVGRNGSLVDYLHGYDPAHTQRLVSSLRLAKTTGPLALPQLNAAFSER